MSHAGRSWQSVVLTVWAAALSVALLFGFLQALLMADIWWISLLMVTVPVGAFLLLRLFIGAVARQQYWARTLLMIIAAGHLILPARQLLGVRPVSVDGLLACAAAAVLFSTVRRRRAGLAKGGQES